MNKEIYNYRKINGLCVRCGDFNSLDKSVFCDICKDICTKRRDKRYKSNKGNGVCIDCLGASIQGKVRCFLCGESARKSAALGREECRLTGRCTTCRKNNSIENGNRCEECWFKDISYVNMGSRKLFKKPRDLFYEQDCKCVYSGKKLIIGLNAEFDHINPRSRGGSNDISNFQWLDKSVNRMKNSLKEDEFFELMELLISRRNMFRIC
jgi:5-methylcytosine-specific restriction endonuclease McrA